MSDHNGSELRKLRAKKPDAFGPRTHAWKRLDRLRAEAEAGASVEELAIASSTPKKQVRAWLKKNGIQVTSSQGLANALDLLGEGSGFPVRHEVEKERGTHPFEAPQYLLRRPLRYSAFCEAVLTLVNAGWSPEAVGEALGLRTADVLNALEYRG